MAVPVPCPSQAVAEATEARGEHVDEEAAKAPASARGARSPKKSRRPASWDAAVTAVMPVYRRICRDVPK